MHINSRGKLNIYNKLGALEPLGHTLGLHLVGRSRGSRSLAQVDLLQNNVNLLIPIIIHRLSLFL